MERLLLQGDLRARIEFGNPCGDESVIVEVNRDRERDDQQAKTLLQMMREPGDALEPGGDGLTAVGDRKHRNGGANRVNNQKQRTPRDIAGGGDQRQDRPEYRTGTRCPDQTQCQAKDKSSGIAAIGTSDDPNATA